MKLMFWRTLIILLIIGGVLGGATHWLNNTYIRKYLPNKQKGETMKKWLTEDVKFEKWAIFLLFALWFLAGVAATIAIVFW